MDLKLEVVSKEIIVYEVKLVDKPIMEFYSEEEALEFVAENINDYVFMRALCDCIVDIKKEENNR